MSDDEERSPLGKALEERKVKGKPFVVNGIFGLGGRPIHKVHVRVPNKGDEFIAVTEAHRFVTEMTQGAESARDDPDMMNDAKAMELIQRAVYDEDDGAQAFYGPNWMRAAAPKGGGFTGDQVGVLVNLMNEVRRADGPIVWDFEEDRVNPIIDLCIRAAGTDIPERVLAPYRREYLSSLVVLLSLKIYELRRPEAHVTRDEDGNFKLTFDDGSGPDFEPLPEGFLNDPDALEALEDAMPDEDEKE